MSESETIKGGGDGMIADSDPDSWVVARLQDCRRQVLHHEARADKEIAARWKRVEKCLDTALAMVLSSAKMPDRPEEKPTDLALSVLREIAKHGDHDPSRIDAVRILLSFEGVTVP